MAFCWALPSLSAEVLFTITRQHSTLTAKHKHCKGERGEHFFTFITIIIVYNRHESTPTSRTGVLFFQNIGWEMMTILGSLRKPGMHRIFLFSSFFFQRTLTLFIISFSSLSTTIIGEWSINNDSSITNMETKIKSTSKESRAKCCSKSHSICPSTSFVICAKEEIK